MKPFNLEEAKAGKPVCTRDGKPVRIICFDRKAENFPLIALVANNYNCEDFYTYTTNGKFYNDGDISDLDLFMISGKHEGYIAIMRSLRTKTLLTSNVYKNKEKCVEEWNETQGYIDTIKIEWKE